LEISASVYLMSTIVRLHVTIPRILPPSASGTVTINAVHLNPLSILRDKPNTFNALPDSPHLKPMLSGYFYSNNVLLSYWLRCIKIEY